MSAGDTIVVAASDDTTMDVPIPFNRISSIQVTTSTDLPASGTIPALPPSPVFIDAASACPGAPSPSPATPPPAPGPPDMKARFRDALYNASVNQLEMAAHAIQDVAYALP